MTLILGIKCVDGIVMCADSQETVGHHRVAVQKIDPRECGKFEIAIGGSGDGDTIDECIDAIHKRVAAASVTFADVKNVISDGILEFYSAHAFLGKAALRNYFLVGVRDRTTQEIDLYRVKVTQLKAVPQFELIGCSYEIYRKLVQERCGNITTDQGALLAVWLLNLAKATSNYVGPPFTIVIFKGKGVSRVKAEEAQTLEDRIEEIGVLVDRLLVTCADVSVDDVAFKGRVEQVFQRINTLRATYHKVSLGHYSLSTEPGNYGVEGMPINETKP